MSRINKLSCVAGAATTVSSHPDTVNANGIPAFSRDAKTNLFLLCVSSMSTDTYYENHDRRSSRLVALVREVAVADPQWVSRFVPWLRQEARMRSAALVAGVEAALAMSQAGIPGGRAVVASVLQRADEPGEALAYATGVCGRALPQCIKRGVADAVVRLYHQRSWIKWDKPGAPWRFGDVINVVHPRPRDAQQSTLFRFICRDRRDHGCAVPLRLDVVRAHRAIKRMAATGNLIKMHGGNDVSQDLRAAGMTWEQFMTMAPLLCLSKRQAWQAIIPEMGVMALLRNLRNFDAAGVSDDVAEFVKARISDPHEVAASRVLPFRFATAYYNTSSYRWAWALSKGMDASLYNVPQLPGRSLILVDTSPSMYYPAFYNPTMTRLSQRFNMPLAVIAAVFGAALALRADAADLYGFGRHSYRVPFDQQQPVLELIKSFVEVDSTDILGAIVDNFDGHDRVVLITDEQSTSDIRWTSRRVEPAQYALNAGRITAFDKMGRMVMNVPKPIDAVVPASVPIYTWNLGGYASAFTGGHGARYTVGGFSDAAFTMLSALESRRDARWPFDV